MTATLLKMFFSLKRRGAWCGQIPPKWKLQKISGGRHLEPYFWSLNQLRESLTDTEAHLDQQRINV